MTITSPSSAASPVDDPALSPGPLVNVAAVSRSAPRRFRATPWASERTSAGYRSRATWWRSGERREVVRRRRGRTSSHGWCWRTELAGRAAPRRRQLRGAGPLPGAEVPATVRSGPGTGWNWCWRTREGDHTGQSGVLYGDGGRVLEEGHHDGQLATGWSIAALMPGPLGAQSPRAIGIESSSPPRWSATSALADRRTVAIHGDDGSLEETGGFRSLDRRPGDRRGPPVHGWRRNDRAPRWAPDGGSLTFLSTRGGSAQLWRAPASGRSTVQLTG
jgi:hypothetical protein